MPSLLSVVRFELIPVDYLYNIVQHHSVAKKLPDFNDHYLRGISFHALSASMKQRLPHQSVKRKDETQPFVAYTWVIPTHKLRGAAFMLSDETLKSEEFWYCGYKIILVISDIVKIGNLRQKHSVFTATLSLKICNLNEQSEVSIEWQPTSECFMFQTFGKTHVFEKEASSSSVDIKYKIEVADISLVSNVFGGVSASATRLISPPSMPSPVFVPHEALLLVEFLCLPLSQASSLVNPLPRQALLLVEFLCLPLSHASSLVNPLPRQALLLVEFLCLPLSQAPSLVNPLPGQALVLVEFLCLPAR